MGKLFTYIILWPVILNFLFSDILTNHNNSLIIENVNTTFSNNSVDPKCTDCHSDLIEKSSKHSAALDDGCTNCHQGDVANHPPSQGKTFTLVEKMPDLCYTCHDALKTEIESSRSVHKIVNQKKFCSNCHSPHSTDQSKLLILTGNELCLSCHNKTISAGNKKITNINQKIKFAKTIHAAIEGGCVSCHKSHASVNNSLLTKLFPQDNYAFAKKDTFSLCFDCHDSGILETEKTTSATGFRNGETNLHFVHINGKKGRNCTMCHDIHATVNEHLILDNVKFGKWSFKMNYIVREKGGTCFPGCHSEKEYIRQ